MSLILKQIFTFLKILNSETGSRQIAVGIVCGMILGFSPVLSLQTLLVILLIFFFRIQLGAALVGAFFFKFVAFLLDGVFDKVGQVVLELEALQPVYTSLYHMPIVPFTKFYNSVVMGAGVTSLILAPFMYFIALYLIDKYRTTVVRRFQATKLWKAIKATSLYKWYYKYDELYG